MQSVASFLLTPALVSLVVTLYVGKIMEARRARRDHITKLFEVTREDIRRAVETTVDYFATPPQARTALQEAKVTLADREIRSVMAVLLSPHPELEGDVRSDAQVKFEAFVAELTGGNFQEKDGEIDNDHIRRLTIAGAGLRSSLARMRDAELKIQASNDVFQTQIRKSSDRWAKIKNYLNS